MQKKTWKAFPISLRYERKNRKEKLEGEMRLFPWGKTWTRGQGDGVREALATPFLPRET